MQLQIRRQRATETLADPEEEISLTNHDAWSNQENGHECTIECLTVWVWSNIWKMKESRQNNIPIFIIERLYVFLTHMYNVSL